MPPTQTQAECMRDPECMACWSDPSSICAAKQDFVRSLYYRNHRREGNILVPTTPKNNINRIPTPATPNSDVMNRMQTIRRNAQRREPPLGSARLVGTPID